MEMERCCICERAIEREDAPVLSMGGAGYARLLCDDCDRMLETATLGTDIKAIEQAMDRIGKIMADRDPDPVTLATVSTLMFEASERAKAIREGSYDFSLDRAESEGMEEIPEELLETEEDKERDRIEEEKNKKFEKVYNFVLIGAIAVAVLFLIWKVVDMFFLK